MALRLTTAKTAFESTRRPGEEALELGRAALATGDLKRYRELFTELAQETDYHRAYKARRVLIELGLEKLSHPSLKTPPRLEFKGENFKISTDVSAEGGKTVTLRLNSTSGNVIIVDGASLWRDTAFRMTAAGLQFRDTATVGYDRRSAI